MCGSNDEQGQVGTLEGKGDDAYDCVDEQHRAHSESGDRHDARMSISMSIAVHEPKRMPLMA
ncbi:hypothetical protein [Bifidobacterium sp. ESL0745]|uniref:hypothetical protein n=1 Tax=Bifidobacterium sp. ESL0745 TaxID=2983226 RepID=UPI0023F8BDAC|nr:hypothetical protein [Bifidobacterium sp. ESL0745]MDF7664520.1 hypothetical protein [Bifidobacterium sp. ESL0745]